MGTRFLIMLIPLLVAPQLSAQRYYRSDPLGLQGAAVTPGEIDEYEWLLRITETDDGTVRVLLRDGEAVEQQRLRSTATGREIRFTELGELSRVERYDRQGRLQSEEIYSGGQRTQRDEYEYTDGQLALHTRFNGAGETLFTEEFHYWRDGSVRMVARSGERQVLYRYRDGLVESEERLEEGLRERYQYDEFGRTVLRELWLEGDLVEQEERDYWGEPPEGLERIALTQGSVVRIERYSRSGELVGTDRVAEGTVLSNAERVFEDGRLQLERERRDGVLFETRYSYEDDELRVRRSFEDGELVEQVAYHALGEVTRTQTIYRDGEALLEIDYDGERRIEERVIRDGTVVRVRTFEPQEDE